MKNVLYGKCVKCGKTYEACCTANWGVFRWRDVACSMECAQEYFRRVEESRTKKQDEDKASKE